MPKTFLSQQCNNRMLWGLFLGGFLLAACSPAQATPAIATAESASLAVNPSAMNALAGTPVETAMPQPSATPSLPASGCPETSGKMDMAQMTTDLQPWPVDMRIYLPPCYDPHREQGYPVLIMIHGQTYNYDQWDRDGMDEKADQLITTGAIQPLIIVMPNESYTDRDPQESNFDVVVTDAVLPWVDAHYHTCTERICRAVGGLSRGATWAVHIGFLRPEVFGSIGGHSFTPFIGDVYRLPYWMMRVTLADLPRFYFDMGSADTPQHIEAIKQFTEKMTVLGIPYEMIWNSGAHDDPYWSAHVEDYLRWYNQAWAKLT